MIYMDYNATTPCDERVVEAMLPYFSKEFGNPSSIYKLGKNSRDAVEKARENVAKLLDCNPEEIFFTSCGT
ncbi:MAG: aminotransferase class V-fold PLP-dependent enzyme, partial [Desulfurella sp.]